MKRKDYSLDTIQYNRLRYLRKWKWLPQTVIWIEDPMWYDGICYYMDRKWRRYSIVAHIPLNNDELCKYWFIYKVKYIVDWPGKYNYHYEILSKREDS